MCLNRGWRGGGGWDGLPFGCSRAKHNRAVTGEHRHADLRNSHTDPAKQCCPHCGNKKSGPKPRKRQSSAQLDSVLTESVCSHRTGRAAAGLEAPSPACSWRSPVGAAGRHGAWGPHTLPTRRRRRRRRRRVRQLKQGGQASRVSTCTRVIQLWRPSRTAALLLGARSRDERIWGRGPL